MAGYEHVQYDSHLFRFNVLNFTFCAVWYKASKDDFLLW